MTDQAYQHNLSRIDALMGKVAPGTPEEAEYLALLAETAAEEDRREAGWPMAAPTHALTLWPEWAWAIEALDKRVENRTWALPPRWIGQRVYLHAGAYPGDAAHRRRLGGVREMAARAGWTETGFSLGDYTGPMRHVDGTTAPALCQGMRAGALIGILHLTACDAPHEGDLGGWRAPDQFGWRFEFEPIAKPVAARGALGFWRVAT